MHCFMALLYSKSITYVSSLKRSTYYSYLYLSYPARALSNILAFASILRNEISESLISSKYSKYLVYYLNSACSSFAYFTLS
mmetsp:Transcript_26070/g.4477  ORF Transcript_26070/g.4477 Transcript_26070/m.4477 type:complete len:82 (+) Transcript_26070:202-447(+)